MALKAFCKAFHLPAASGRQATVAGFLQEVNASDQGSPVEAEARPPDRPTKARHPPAHAHLPEGGRVKKMIPEKVLSFKGAMNPKVDGKGRRPRSSARP